MARKYKSWIKNADGNVWNATGDPSKREFYINTVMHHNFGEEFKNYLTRKVAETMLVSGAGGSIVKFNIAGTVIWSADSYYMNVRETFIDPDGYIYARSES